MHIVFDTACINHNTRDAQLLVNATHHNALVHALILAANEVAIHVNVQVIHGLHVRQRHVHENVINVEAMLGKLQMNIAQKLRTVNHRMHKQILALGETADLGPAEFTTLREHVAIPHDLLGTFVHLFIHVIANHHIRRFGKLHLAAQICHDFLHGIGIKPVVGVNNFEVAAGCFANTGIHTRTMAAIFLVDCLDDVRVAALPLVGLLARVVFRRTVIHDKNFNVIAAGQKRFNAFIHIRGGVVARNSKSNGFHFSHGHSITRLPSRMNPCRLFAQNPVA